MSNFTRDYIRQSKTFPLPVPAKIPDNPLLQTAEPQQALVKYHEASPQASTFYGKNLDQAGARRKTEELRISETIVGLINSMQKINREVMAIDLTKLGTETLRVVLKNLNLTKELMLGEAVLHKCLPYLAEVLDDVMRRYREESKKKKRDVAMLKSLAQTLTSITEVLARQSDRSFINIVNATQVNKNDNPEPVTTVSASYVIKKMFKYREPPMPTDATH